MLRFQMLLVLTVALVSSVAWAEKPEKSDGGKHKSKGHQEKRHEKHGDAEPDYSSYKPQGHHADSYSQERYFNDRHRTIVREYYVHEFRAGRCPPGLAKKNNGCLPPGQAKRWVIGRPLPRDVIYYDLPDYMVRQIGYPPAGYRLVRVASDILMLAVGTGLVVDAMTDLSSMP